MTIIIMEVILNKPTRNINIEQARKFPGEKNDMHLKSILLRKIKEHMKILSPYYTFKNIILMVS